MAHKQVLNKTETDALKKISIEKTIDLLHYCADEKLGLVSVGEYNKMTGTPRRTIYDMIENDRLKCVELCGLKMIIINDK